MGAGQRFEVPIVALDGFTKVFRRLNESASRAVRPLTNIQRSTGALFRELHLPGMVKGFQAASRAVQGFASGLGQAAAPLQALFGIGAAGSVVGALAAAAAVTTKWAQAGFEVNRTAQAIGVSAQDLQRYQGAAKLAGLSVESMTGAMQSLAQTLQDAAFGRNPAALMMLEKLGIPMRRNAQGLLDVTGILDDLSRSLSRISDPQTRRVVASAFGLEEALPLLLKGPEEIRRLANEAERLGIVQGPKALEWAEKFTASINRMTASLQGAANAFGAFLGPRALDTMDRLTALIDRMAANPGSEFKQGMLDLFSGRMTRDALKAPPINLSRQEADQLAKDVGAGAQFHSPELRERLVNAAIRLDVNIPNAPPGTTVGAYSTNIPVRIGRPVMPY